MKNKSATEVSVGCRCFSNQMAPMSGIIKHKYSDFHVNEIDRSGNIVRLTSICDFSEPSYPDGYEDWLKSNQHFFSFVPESDEQVARIYYEQPTFSVLEQNGKVTVERLYKKKTRPFYLHFVLYKENINQQSAIGKIAQKVGKQKKMIGFAGSKDKRGITTQICSIKDVQPEKFIQAVQNIDEHIKIGKIKIAVNPVSLGDLSGNRFTIVLRDIKLEGDNDSNIYEGVKRRVEELDKSGFINYFGMQRFGTSVVPTHKIGELVLKRKWREIIDILLEPQESDVPRLKEAKELFKKTHDAKQALKILPHSAQTEYSIFEAMSRLPQDQQFSNPYELFSRIDRRQRMMYIHAYQSYLWNHMVSNRIEKYGTKIVIGDKVLIENGKKNKENVIDVTESNINNYTIFDVAIALPSGKMSNDEVDPDLIQLMEKDGVTFDMFNGLSSEYGANGDWRFIMAKAKDLEWTFIRHNDRDAELIDSDLNIIEGVTNSVNHSEDGKYSSLSLSFSLGSGQYATMCLRELLKRSTEWFTDSSMSNPQKHWWETICNIC